MREERRHLGVLVAVAVDVLDRVGIGRLTDPEATGTHDPRDVGGTQPGHGRAVRQDRVEERLWLGDADDGYVPPQPRRPVQRADDDRDDEDDQRPQELGRGEDREDPEALEGVDEPGADDRVVPGVDLVHRGRVVAGRAEREVRQLLQRHADRGERREEDDLDDREVDRGQQAPQAAAELGEGIRRRGGRGRPDDGRCRHDADLDADGGLLDRSGRDAGDRPGPPRSRPGGPRGPPARRIPAAGPA